MGTEVIGKKSFVEKMRDQISGTPPPTPPPDAPTNEELYSVVLSLKQEIAALRAQKAAEPVEEMPLLKPSSTLDNVRGPGKVLFYAKFHCLRIGLKHQRVGRIPMQNGEFEKVTRGDSLHAQFANNRCWIPKEYVDHLRHVEGYGRDFIEAFDAPTIPKGYFSLETLLNAPENSDEERQAEEWTKRIEQNGKDASIPTPLRPMQIQKEVLRGQLAALPIAV